MSRDAYHGVKLEHIPPGEIGPVTTDQLNKWHAVSTRRIVRSRESRLKGIKTVCVKYQQKLALLKKQINDLSKYDLKGISDLFVEAKTLNHRLNLKQFAASIGLPLGTVTLILTRDQKIKSEVLSKIRERTLADSLDIDASMVKRAKKGDPQAATLWYKRVEGWIPTEKREVQDTTPQLTSEERAIIEEIKSRMRVGAGSSQQQLPPGTNGGNGHESNQSDTVDIG